MYKCWNDFNKPESIIGYVQEKNLKNPALVSHYLYDTSIFNEPKCKSCALFPLCDGGCQWFRHKNIFEGKESNMGPFFINQHILEDCLLANEEKRTNANHQTVIS